MRLILLGSPGVGKGTQSQLISQQFQIPQISTGEMLRKAIKQKSALGDRIKQIVESGQLVPDDVMIELIRARISEPDCEHGFLLDGFPRTLAQAQALQDLTPIDYVLEIVVPEDEIIKRISGRLIHPASGRIYHSVYNPPKKVGKDDITGEALIQRQDDTIETIKQRLAVYHDQTKPLVKYYQENPNTVFVSINGLQSIDAIKHEIFSILKEKK